MEELIVFTELIIEALYLPMISAFELLPLFQIEVIIGITPVSLAVLFVTPVFVYTSAWIALLIPRMIYRTWRKYV